MGKEWACVRKGICSTTTWFLIIIYISKTYIIYMPYVSDHLYILALLKGVFFRNFCPRKVFFFRKVGPFIGYDFQKNESHKGYAFLRSLFKGIILSKNGPKRIDMY